MSTSLKQKKQKTCKLLISKGFCACLHFPLERDYPLFQKPVRSIDKCLHLSKRTGLVTANHVQLTLEKRTLSMQIRRKKKQDSILSLAPLVKDFARLIREEGEEEAAEELDSIHATITKTPPQASKADLEKICARLEEAFEGEHELNCYLFRREGFKNWSRQEDLYLAASKLWAIEQRLTRSLASTKE